MLELMLIAEEGRGRVERGWLMVWMEAEASCRSKEPSFWGGCTQTGNLAFSFGWVVQARHSLLCSVAAVSFGSVCETDCCFLDAKRSSKTLELLS